LRIRPRRFPRATGPSLTLGSTALGAGFNESRRASGTPLAPRAQGLRQHSRLALVDEKSLRLSN